MEDEMKWPIEKCENCGKDFTDIVPKPRDKALSGDGSGKLKWADFCPNCGRGYIVGDRFIVKPRQVSAQSVASQSEILAQEPDPHPELEGEPKSAETEPVAGPPRTAKDGEYFCTDCAKIHRETSKQGKRHLKFKEA